MQFERLSPYSRRRCSRRQMLAGLGLLLSAAGCRMRHARGPERDASGRLVLHFWNGFTGPDGKTMQAIVDRFRQENPDIDVRMQIIPWSTYYDKLTLALAYGGAPEVFVVHAGRLPQFAAYDALRPLQDRYAGDTPPLTAADFAPVPWKASFYQGTQFGLPLDVHLQGLYYNRDLFERAGIVDAAGQAKPPTNSEEFLDAARRLTRDTDGDGQPDQWGFVFTWQRTNFITFASQFGGGILTPDLTHSAMDSPATQEAAHYMHDLIYRHKVAPRPEGIDAWLAFRQGKVGMALEGIYMLASLEEQTGLRYAGAPVPRFGSQPGTWGDSHVLAQPGTPASSLTDEQSRAAWRLMRYISDHSLAWAKGGQVPARLAVEQSADFQALPVQSAFARQLADVHYTPLTPKANALFPFIDPAIEAILLDLQTTEAALTSASKRIDEVLSRP